ncbi:beta-lactamase family protein [bacterium]|nr:beta-lactamase family protein [bacterium]
MPLVAIVCAVVFPPWDGILAWLAPLPDTVQEQVDAAAEREPVGIIVYVDQAGKPPALYAAGWKDRANQVPADPHALFKIASISKLYIAAATAKLVSAERISLDDTLDELLPDVAGRIEYADRISLRMMLSHRSGIPNFTDQKGFEWAKPRADGGGGLGLILDKPADFVPDTDQEYSNTNYLLIGRILDRTLGYSHQRYIKEEILDPLGLEQTFGSLSNVNLDDVASGYHIPYEADLKEINYVTPGGSMIATAEDVGVFLRALNDGSLFTEDEREIYSSIYEYGHKGWLLGYQSIARYHKDSDSVIVQFVNTTGGDTELTALVVYGRIVKIVEKQ